MGNCFIFFLVTSTCRNGQPDGHVRSRREACRRVQPFLEEESDGASRKGNGLAQWIRSKSVLLPTGIGGAENSATLYFLER